MKTLEKYQKAINKIQEICIKIENGYADGIYNEDKKEVATLIFDTINKILKR